MKPYRESVIDHVEECRSCQLKRMRRAAQVKWLRVVAWPVVKVMLIALPWCLLWAERQAGHGMMPVEAYTIAGGMLGGSAIFGNWFRILASKPDVD